MCGITAYWGRETAPTYDVLTTLFRHAERRGTDSFGCYIFNRSIGYRDEGYRVSGVKIVGKPDYESIRDRIEPDLGFGSIVLANHRAAPETEPLSLNTATIQPIIRQDLGCALVHNGSVSEFIVEKLKEMTHFESEIDSEAIIVAYCTLSRNMLDTMQYLSGGFAFILFDMMKHKLFAVSTHNPLYCGYVRGYGMFFSSFEQAIYDTISKLKNTPINRNNTCVWEDYYCRKMPENTITEIDLQSGMINEFPFEPRYVHPQWDPYILKRDNQLREENTVLVAASGGLDSTTTLATLKYAGYDVRAVHFRYGHRGQEAEEIAIRKITDILDVPLTVFDIEQNVKMFDSESMLTDPDHVITTGTKEHLKTTIAWTTFRNGLFVTYMGALAESIIIKERRNSVSITGGFMQLTESGVYPDNSERFIDAFMKFAKFASITGTRIKPIYACANLLKTNQYWLLWYLGVLEDVMPWLVSCDRPLVKDGIPYNCSKDGLPACGSGLLSFWALNKAKLPLEKDLRRYYEIEGDYEPYVPPWMEQEFPEEIRFKQGDDEIVVKADDPGDIVNIMNRLELHPKRKEQLLKHIESVGRLRARQEEQS